MRNSLPPNPKGSGVEPPREELHPRQGLGITHCVCYGSSQESPQKQWQGKITRSLPSHGYRVSPEDAQSLFPSHGFRTYRDVLNEEIPEVSCGSIGHVEALMG